MKSTLKSLALRCKILAIVVWIFMDWQEVVNHIGPLNKLLLSVYLVVTLVALVPNRWLVSLPIAFIASFLIAITPWCYAIHNVAIVMASAAESPHPILGISISFAVLIIYSVIIFLPLPCSLLFSFRRARKGEQVTYA
jgi:hypothetical protein